MSFFQVDTFSHNLVNLSKERLGKQGIFPDDIRTYQAPNSDEVVLSYEFRIPTRQLFNHKVRDTFQAVSNHLARCEEHLRLRLGTRRSARFEVPKAWRARRSAR